MRTGLALVFLTIALATGVLFGCGSESLDRPEAPDGAASSQSIADCDALSNSLRDSFNALAMLESVPIELSRKHAERACAKAERDFAAARKSVPAETSWLKDVEAVLAEERHLQNDLATEKRPVALRYDELDQRLARRVSETLSEIRKTRNATTNIKHRLAQGEKDISMEDIPVVEAQGTPQELHRQGLKLMEEGKILEGAGYLQKAFDAAHAEKLHELAAAYGLDLAAAMYAVSQRASVELVVRNSISELHALQNPDFETHDRLLFALEALSIQTNLSNNARDIALRRYQLAEENHAKPAWYLYYDLADTYKYAEEPDKAKMWASRCLQVLPKDAPQQLREAMLAIQHGAKPRRQ